MKFNPAFGMKETLQQAQTEKARVEIHLRSGTSFTGFVEEVGEHFATVTRLADRDFFDAVLRIEDVSAVVAQARTRADRA